MAADQDSPANSVGIVIAMNDVGRRLAGIEASLASKQSDSPKSNTALLEVLKVLFGGWPAFALILLLLFYVPLRDALNEIPDKVRKARNISVGTISLQSTIKDEAVKLGTPNLANTVPRLSADATYMLLHAPADSWGLIGMYERVKGEGYYSIELPNIAGFTALEELQRHQLIDLGGFVDDKEVTLEQAAKALTEFRKSHPADEYQTKTKNRVRWVFHKHVPTTTVIPSFTWELTPLGAKAVEVVASAVHAELQREQTPTEKK
ncbi:hypothetical protein C7T35_15370 [Variovorax sp. WS11]|uniref:hypothetical protein n=1 Tax=Variovorax sp. WS11 TaxID=1105204 RepID=UPI000D0DF96E|nr:hypothetical protein [Variovorax sp. WS11]NDZ12057.1 hypothetical protein [Variovorax sp. WS11]PSL83760.1 hypothetical protein C7T35_15370 [Variovorax sp. WS11]